MILLYADMIWPAVWQKQTSCCVTSPFDVGGTKTRSRFRSFRVRFPTVRENSSEPIQFLLSRIEHAKDRHYDYGAATVVERSEYCKDGISDSGATILRKVVNCKEISKGVFKSLWLSKKIFFFCWQEVMWGKKHILSKTIIWLSKFGPLVFY